MSWPQVKLESIFDIARGGSPRPIDDYITDADDGLNWISIKDASNSNKYIETTKLKIKPEGLSKTRQVKPGDFLLTNSMSFGRPYIMKTTGCIHDGWLVLSGDPEKVDSDYFYHLLGSDLLKRRFSALAAGAVVKNLNIDLVKGVEIPLPPLPEQKRIAAILDKADAIRRKRHQAIQLADDFLRAVFLDMFGDPVTNPKGWAIHKMSDVIDFKGGSQPPKETFEYEEKEGYIRLVQIRDFRTDKFKTYIPESLAKRRFEIDDVMIGRYGPPVFQILRGLSGSYNVALMKAAPKEGVTKDFVYRLLQLPAYQDAVISNSERTAGQTGVNLDLLNSLDVPLPPLDIQILMSERVGKVEELASKLKLDLHDAESLFSSLSQKAFRGEL